MIASAALHGSGLVEGRLPQGLLIVGFVATGAVIGVRFRGTRLAALAATVPGALGSVLLAQGFTRLVNVWGGMTGWMEAGLPVEE